MDELTYISLALYSRFISIPFRGSAAYTNTMTKPTLYLVPKTIGSPIYQILIELDLVEVVQVTKLSFGDIKTEDYLQNINPMGTSPAYVHENHSIDGSIKIFESGAILSWILEEYDTDHAIHPAPRQPGRSSFIFLQQYIVATVYPFLATLYLHSLKPKEEQDSTYVNQSKQKFVTLLGPTLESQKIGDGDWMIGGKNPSAVDYLLAKPLGNADSLGLLDDFPSLKNILKKIQARPSYCEAYGTECKNNSSNKKGEMRSLILIPEHM